MLAWLARNTVPSLSTCCKNSSVSFSTSSGPTPLEYWEPSDGSYSDDIRAKFPAAAADEALNDQAYIDALRSACEEQAQKAQTSTQG